MKKSANYYVYREKKDLVKKMLITMFIGKRTDCVKKALSTMYVPVAKRKDSVKKRSIYYVYREKNRLGKKSANYYVYIGKYRGKKGYDKKDAD